MNHIFCIIGLSGTGKDTVLRTILDDATFVRGANIHKIVSYTTRPKRDNEIKDVDYHYTTKNKYMKLKADDKISIISVHLYIVKPKVSWLYFITDEDIDLNHYNYICITSPEEYNDLVLYYGKKTIVPIYIEIDAYTRLCRSIDREYKNGDKLNGYKEICRRFISDEEDTKKIIESNPAITSNSFINYNYISCTNKIKVFIINTIREANRYDRS